MQTFRYPNMSQSYRPPNMLGRKNSGRFGQFIYLFVYLFVVYLTTLPVTQTNIGSTMNSKEFGRRRA